MDGREGRLDGKLSGEAAAPQFLCDFCVLMWLRFFQPQRTQGYTQRYREEILERGITNGLNGVGTAALGCPGEPARHLFQFAERRLGVQCRSSKSSTSTALPPP